MNQPTVWSIDGTGSFYVPNDYGLRLAEQDSPEFVPAESIHPARPDETIHWSSKSACRKGRRS